METKICSKCKIEKELSQFRKAKKYYISWCKDCEKEYRKDYMKKYREVHKEEIKEYRKEYGKKYSHNYYENNKETYRKREKEYRKTPQRKLYTKNYNKKYRLEHKEEYKNYRKKDMERRMSNPTLKVELQIRNMINTSFKRKGLNKSKRTKEIVGMELRDFYEYLLQTFKDNYGYDWDEIEPVHIDHIKPLATANTEEEVIKLCYYTNLQLLKAKDNLEKGSRLNWKLKEK